MPNTNTDFEEVFKLQFSALCNVANNIIKNEKASEDIVQEIFVKLWQNKNRLSEVNNIKAYLYRSVTNSCIDYLKRNKNVISIGLIHNNEASSPSHGESIMIEKELELRIEKALRQLPPKCKAIFVLSRHEGLKYKEIAEYLKISAKTVENQMGIALSKLRKELQSYLTKEFTVPVLKASEPFSVEGRERSAI